MCRVELTGRLVKDPEVYYAANGKAVTKFRFAENIYNKTKQENDAQFHNVVAFGKTAELIGNTLSKGRKIHVAGVLTYRQYEDKEKIIRYFTQIIVREFDYCDNKKDNATAPVA